MCHKAGERYSIPRPVQIMIRANETVAGIIHNPEMVLSCIFKVLSHLQGEFHARVRTAGYRPRLRTIVEALAEELFKLQQILLDSQVVFPSQK